MNNKELIERAGSITLAVIQGESDPIYIHGIQITGVDRDIFRRVTWFEFENGWRIPANVGGLVESSEIVRLLTIQVEQWMGAVDRIQLEAFNSPETLIDEDPDELDPYPVFVCQCCRDDYEL